MSIEVGTARTVVVGRNVQSDLNVVECVIEAMGRYELLSEGQDSRLAQCGVPGGEPGGGEEVEVGSDCVRRRRVLLDDVVDLEVNGRQQLVWDRPGDHNVAVVGQANELVGGQHARDRSRA